MQTPAVSYEDYLTRAATSLQQKSHGKALADLTQAISLAPVERIVARKFKDVGPTSDGIVKVYPRDVSYLKDGRSFRRKFADAMAKAGRYRIVNGRIE